VVDKKWIVRASKGDTSLDGLRRFLRLKKRQVYIMCTDVNGLHDYMGIL